MSPLVIALLVSACVVAASLNVHHNTTSIEASLRDQTFIFEDFADAKKFHDRWIPSRHKDYENQPYVIKPPVSPVEGFELDNGLLLSKKDKYYGLTLPFETPLTMGESPSLVIQYEIKFEEVLACGGAYVKLLRDTTDFGDLNKDTPYTILFGPDKCGSDKSKIHFIMQHQNPISKVWEEKHLNDTITFKYDKKMHVYTLEILNKENEFNVYVDKKLVKTGSFFTHLRPSINPGMEIDDPSDTKPSDWVDEAKIDDPDSKKPDDWDEDQPKLISDSTAVKPANWHDDEPEEIPDPKATKPGDWDDESDGEWYPPSIPNPKCANGNCGDWNAPMIKNPLYKGKWKPKKIANPLYSGPWTPRKIKNDNYFVDDHPSNIAPMTGLSLELWTTNGGIFLDNFVITRSLQDAFAVADQTWKLKVDAEVSIQNAINEKKKKDKEDRRNARKEKQKNKGAKPVNKKNKEPDNAASGKSFIQEYLDKYHINIWAVIAAGLAILLVAMLLSPDKPPAPSVRREPVRNEAPSEPSSDPSSEPSKVKRTRTTRSKKEIEADK